MWRRVDWNFTTSSVERLAALNLQRSTSLALSKEVSPWRWRQQVAPKLCTHILIEWDHSSEISKGHTYFSKTSSHITSNLSATFSRSIHTALQIEVCQLHATLFANFTVFIVLPDSAFNKPIIYLSNTQNYHCYNYLLFIYKGRHLVQLPSDCHNSMSHYLLLLAFIYQVITSYNW